MRAALAFGPGRCPPHLFAGPVDAVVRGLKAHANAITHARHLALEDTYPRTRAMMGDEAFHAIAEQHLADPARLRLPHTLIGMSFADRLTGSARNIAVVEWAWLKAHGAADVDPFDLAAIAGLDASYVARAIVVRHAAARLVSRITPAPLVWDGVIIEAPFILLTRPHADVVVTGVDHTVAQSLELLSEPRPLAELLEFDSAAATTLVTAGALTLYPEILL